MAFTMSSRFAAIMLLGTGLCEVDANTFLKPIHSSLHEHISEETVQSSLLAEIEGTFGAGSATSKLTVLQTALAPMFNALPKNEHGYLGHATVRYALHRLFIQRHGWLIKGLHEAGGHRNSTSTAGLLKEQVPAYVQELIEKRLGDRGLGLRELSTVAATIEHLVHNEAVKRLGQAFKVHKLLPTSVMNETAADEVLDTYMTGYILGEDLSNMSTEEALLTKADMNETFGAWVATQKFVRAVRENVTRSEGTADQRTTRSVDFSLVARAASRIGEQFGKFQDHECKEIKASLLAIEESQTGRVRLSDFWKPALDGSWQFQESRKYLRQLGALDESDQHNPRVMIANYVGAQSNCIASSNFYSVCCVDECEDLLRLIEKKFAAPEASYDQIAAFVSELPSSTVTAPRKLSNQLLHRLEMIATGQGNLVQFHGRLFAQWMHHAFPRECPYPHVSGTTNPQTPDEWFESTGEDSIASFQELEDQVEFEKSLANRTEMDVDSLLWSSEEELLVVRTLPQTHTSKGSLVALSARSAVLFVVLATVIYGLARPVLAVPQAIPEKFVI